MAKRAKIPRERFSLVISADRPNAHYWKDLWSFRELALLMAWRDLTVRYKQSMLGPAWAVVRPLATMLVGVLVFGKMAGFESEELPYEIAAYSLFIFAGTLPWQLFSTGLTMSTLSFTRNAAMIQKIFFPRIISPVSALAVSFADFLIGLIIFFLMAAVMGYWPGWQIIALPFFLALAAVLALGGGLWFGTMNVRFRDISQIIPFALQLGLFLTPVMYPASQIEEKFGAAAGWIYALNPLVGILDGCRWALLGGESLALGPVIVSIIVTAVVFLFGHAYFRRMELTFADVV